MTELNEAMEDALPERLSENEEAAVSKLYPSPNSSSHNPEDQVLDSVAKQISEKSFNSPKGIVIHDTDCDGLTAAALFEATDPNNFLRIPVHHNNTASIGEYYDLVAEELEERATLPLQYDFEKVFLVDHDFRWNSDDETERSVEQSFRKFMGDFFEQYDTLTVYDHHKNWQDTPLSFSETSTEEQVNSTTINGVVDHERCGAKIVFDELSTEDTDEKFERLAVVANDHDLWIKEIEQSDLLASAAYVLDNETYIDKASREGITFLREPTIYHQLVQSRRNKETSVSRALDRTTFHDIGQITVAITYGYCPQSYVGSELISKYDSDLVLLITPHGKVSARSHENSPVSARDVAMELGGGGHTGAAAGKPIELYNLTADSEDCEQWFQSLWGSLGGTVTDDLVDIVENLLKSEV